jgi:hypothetical protein
MKQFLDMPLWLSIPLLAIYLGIWACFFYTIYYFSDWRERRMKKKQKKQKP